jgi:hypothetical protein
MQDAPTKLEMIEAVKAFLEEKAMPELEGHTAFHARVAANVLGILTREYEQGPQNDAEERDRLRLLLSSEGSLEDLNRELCSRIKAREIGLGTTGLKEHLIKTTIRKVEIDQPKYSGLKIAKQKWGNGLT